MSASETAAKSKDKEFEPTIEMMIHDFDDEGTLEEEERLAQAEQLDPEDELNSLQREQDMPIEQLLAMYYNQGPKKEEEAESKGESSSAKEGNQDAGSGGEVEAVEDEEDEEGEPEGESELKKLYPEEFTAAQPIRLRTSSRPASEESDGDYSPDDDDIKKTIMVGSDFQAQIPEDFCKYDDALPYENKDKLVWDPTKVSEEEIVDFLTKVSQMGSPATPNISTTTTTTTTGAANPTVTQAIKALTSVPTGKHLRDDEQALFLLQQCGHNVEEALRRRRISNVPPVETMSAWSEEECRLFESGLRMYGKDFHQIQLSKVKTRSVGELVQFYYLWKKTERHDVFANKARLDKKKYSLNPGLTDYMDRFLEDQEGTNGGLNGAQYRDRSSSPGITSLLYADSKRQRIEKQQKEAASQQQGDVVAPEMNPPETAESPEKKPLSANSAAN